MTRPEVREYLRDPRGGPGLVGGPSGRSGTGREKLLEVRDGSEEPSGRFGTSRVTHREVRDGSGTLGEVSDKSGESQGGPRHVKGASRRFGTVR